MANQVNWTQSILDQMGQAGKPKKTTTTVTKNESLDWGQIGLLLALLLGDTAKEDGGGTGMIGEILAPPQAAIPGMGIQGPAMTAPAAPAALSAGPSPVVASGAGVPGLTPAQVQELYKAFRTPTQG